MEGIIRKLRDQYDMLKQTRIWQLLKNKYILTSLIFFVWLLLFDQNNLNERRKLGNEYKELIEEKQYYQDKIDEDSKRIEELKTNNENLEKFAREQYLMKKKNEDVFVIVDEDK